MKTVDLTMPELGTIAATRGMLGAGAGLLVASALPEPRRKAIARATARVRHIRMLALNPTPSSLSTRASLAFRPAAAPVSPFW